MTVDDIEATTTGYGVLIYGGPGFSQVDSVVRDSTVSEAIYGVFVQDAHSVTIEDTRLTGSCQGLFAFDDNAGGGTGELVVRDNRLSANNQLCSPSDATFGSSFQRGGVVLLGATRSRVVDNTVDSNIGGAINSGGIIVTSSAPFFGGANPDGDIVQDNHATRNQPADVIWDGNWHRCQLRRQYCATSIIGPPGTPVGTKLCTS